MTQEEVIHTGEWFNCRNTWSNVAKEFIRSVSLCAFFFIVFLVFVWIASGFVCLVYFSLFFVLNCFFLFIWCLFLVCYCRKVMLKSSDACIYCTKIIDRIRKNITRMTLIYILIISFINDYSYIYIYRLI